MVSSIPGPGKTNPDKMEIGIPITEQCFKKEPDEISLKWKAEQKQSAPKGYPNRQTTEEGRRK